MLSIIIMLPALGTISQVDHVHPEYMWAFPFRTVSPNYLVLFYVISTCSELCISPVGLSSMSKLAPARLAGMVMGTWFLAAAIGNYLAGRAAQLSEAHGFGFLFWLLIIASLVIAAALFAVAPAIKKMLERVGQGAAADGDDSRREGGGAVKYLLVMLALSAACDESKPDTPAVVEAKAQCKQVLEHMVTISPRGEGKDPAQVVAGLPIEDLQACVATEPEIRDCMLHATDVAAVKKCPPSGEVVACMQKAWAARDRPATKAKKPDGDPALDKPFDDIRAKCWAGDAHAADQLKIDG